MNRHQLEIRVELWRDRLAPEWRITLDPNAPPGHEDAVASCQADNDYEHARMHFTDYCLGLELPVIDKVIIHEILHLLFREGRRCWDAVDGQVHRDVRTAVDHQHDSWEERVIERLARTIAQAEHPAAKLQYGVVSD